MASSEREKEAEDDDVSGATSSHQFLVVDNLADAAVSILNHSFAIYKPSIETFQAIQQAWQEGTTFFDNPDPTCRKIVKGHLHGYNVPSRAKALFRAFAFSGSQPWPPTISDDNPNQDSLEKASKRVATKLHEVLVDCCDEIQKKVTTKNHHLNNDSQNAHENPSPRKRPRTEPQQSNSSLKLPRNAKDTVSSPLDYFFYHGRDPSAVNCSEHVDRGVLIGVCLSTSPGLEVEAAAGTRDFWCPEEHSLYSSLEQQDGDGEQVECRPIQLICIMAGGQLSQLVPKSKCAPCLHRVRDQLKRARLSISYELRA